VFFRCAVVAAAAFVADGLRYGGGWSGSSGNQGQLQIANPEKVDRYPESTANGRSIFRCKPLACPENSTSSASATAPSPNSQPRSGRLAEIWRRQMQSARWRQTEQASTEAIGRLRDLTLLSSRVVKMKEFPAVHWEYRATGASDQPIYVIRDMVFAGNTMIDVISTSLGVEVAPPQ